MRQLIERVLDEGIVTGKFDPRDREKAHAFITDAVYRFINPLTVRLDAEVPQDILDPASGNRDPGGPAGPGERKRVTSVTIFKICNKKIVSLRCAPSAVNCERHFETVKLGLPFLRAQSLVR